MILLAIIITIIGLSKVLGILSMSYSTLEQLSTNDISPDTIKKMLAILLFDGVLETFCGLYIVYGN